MTRSPEFSVKLNGPTLNGASADLAGIVEFDVAHFDLGELLRGLGRDFIRQAGDPRELDLQLREPVGRRIGRGDDRDRLHEAGARADDEHERGHGLGDGAGRHAEHRHDERDRAEQDVERGLQQHHAAIGFALGADLDVGGGPRDVDEVIEQRVAARPVEPDLLEAVEHVAQAIVQLVFPSRRFAHLDGMLLGLGMEDRGAGADDDDAQHKCDERQIGDIDRHQCDQQRALHREGQHVARLRQDRGVAGDGGHDFGAADRFQRQQLGAANVVHQPHPQLVDDGADLGGRGDQDVMLRLDEQQQRDDEKSRGPEADLALVRGAGAGVDRADDGGRAEAAHGRYEDQPAQRAFHFTANELEKGHKATPSV